MYIIIDEKGFGGGEGEKDEGRRRRDAHKANDRDRGIKRDGLEMKMSRKGMKGLKQRFDWDTNIGMMSVVLVRGKGGGGGIPARSRGRQRD